jgi:hypothetical protein
MSSSWILRTRQMSEAGKEILVREALASHMRSARDRQLVAELMKEKRPLEDIVSFFAAYYLTNYQDVRLKGVLAAEELPGEQKDQVTTESRRLLELEIRRLLGKKQREEFDVARLVSEFMIALCDDVDKPDSSNPQTVRQVAKLLQSHIGRIPKDSSGNHEIDFINEVTGWGSLWRDDVYTKASGLRESSLSLREELLKEHEPEIPETAVLLRCIAKVFGSTPHSNEKLSAENIADAKWEEIAQAVIQTFAKVGQGQQALKRAHQLRLEALDAIEGEFNTPTSLEDFENRLGDLMARRIAEEITLAPSDAYAVLGYLLGLNPNDIRTALRPKGIANPTDLIAGLGASPGGERVDAGGAQTGRGELEDVDRSLKALDKIEQTLEKSVKGVLRSKGLKSTELDKISIQLLAKDRNSLIGIEIQVVEQLKKLVRVPPPQEIVRLIKLREDVKRGALTSVGVSSGPQISHQLRQDETIRSLKLDVAWHLMIGLFTNLTRVVETYIRSKQDLLRIRALLKSIYEKTESELQFYREEILVDFATVRIHEIKRVYSEMGTTTLWTWFHARLSNEDMDSARSDLTTTASPVFEGVAGAPLKLEELEFDNYAIAFDVMNRFLRREGKVKLAKEEVAVVARLEEERIIDSKRKDLDVLTFVYTKSQTVFRAIGRAGPAGLKWSPADDMKCANLLSFYVRQHRGRPFCTVCGATPKEGSCPNHGSGNMNTSTDLDNLAVFIMEAISEVKIGLIGSFAERMPWDKARAIVQKEITVLKQRGKLSAKTNLKQLLPGEIEHIVAPALVSVVAQYFNESLEYAARRADLA